jgi:protein phosphatase
MNLQNKIRIIGLTDTGMVRSKNEDAIGYDSALGLVVLADGMGGHRGGEIASSMTVDTIIELLQKRLPEITAGEVDEASGFSMESICIQDAVVSANEQVYKAAETNPEHKGMGTTIVVLQFYNNSFSLAHIGDSRCYRLRNNKLEQITKDHSLLQELIDRGFYTPEEARNSMNNDIYLLCSDGLTDLVEDEDMYYTIKEFSANLEEAAKQLITKANQNGGKDNISVMLCRIDEDFSTKQGWFKKFAAWFD